MRIRSLLAAVAVAAMVVLAAPAEAQRAFKYVFPDGRVVYSDKPVPGAKLEGEVQAPPPPAFQTVPPSAVKPAAPGAAKDGSREETAAARQKRFADADAEVRAATSALEQARAQLETGKEPLPGERTGTAGGGSRLNEAYEARQQANERAVAEAQERLQRAVGERNALR
jgi:hypothetical protein